MVVGSVELLEECERATDKRLQFDAASTITHGAAGTGSVGHQQHETACAILSGELIDEPTLCSHLVGRVLNAWTSDACSQGRESKPWRVRL